jgi:hypothetical protein
MDHDSNPDRKIKTFVEKSTWVPKTNQLPESAIETINNIEKHYRKITQNVPYTQNFLGEKIIKLMGGESNTSREENRCLKNLSKLSEIVIKPADKGGATVLMDKQNYITEAYRQLNDPKYYRKLTEPTYKSNIPLIAKILEDLRDRGHISNKQLKYLAGPTECRARTFYLLPKIHKDRKSWTIPDKMPQGRPIVSDVNSESYRVSDYIDSFLNPLASKHKSYIKNTYDFVDRIRNQRIPNSHFLVTGDVTSLYTNMDIGRTIEETRKILANSNQSIPSKQILELLTLTMNNNDFEFNGEYFLQICGTAMGKKYAPSLANIYLIDFDEAAMSGFRIKPSNYGRYLDDVFFTWGGSVEELKEFENFLNNLIPGIKITLEYCQKEINFLDTTIYKQNINGEQNWDTLQTKIFFKPTDTHQLLHVSSHHPKHTTRGILRSQLIRFKRISANKTDYDETCKILFGFLKNRGYKFTFMRQQQTDIWFNYKEKDKTTTIKTLDTPMIPIINIYNKIGIQLTRGYREILKNDSTLGKCKLIAAYRNPKNLYQTIIRSKLNPDPEPNIIPRDHNPGFKQCCSTQCLTCKIHSQNTKIFTSSRKNQNHTITQSLSCNTTNIIYLITCKKCNIQYVGETSRSLAQRLTDHRSNIKNKKLTPIADHFNSREHSVNDLQAIPIEKIIYNDSKQNTLFRKQREQFWQNLLVTKYPSGLNEIIKHIDS